MAAMTTGVLETGLPLAFSSHMPEDEHEVQDVAEALLVNQATKWLREGPLLPSSVVKTKPDFSVEEPRFFIEMKYPKDRGRLNGVITEIPSRIHLFASQGASVLFAIHDPARVIASDKQFVSGLGLPPTMFAQVIR